MFSRIFSSRNSLSSQESLDLAKLHLENARKEKRPKMALALCNDANDLLSNMKRAIKKSQTPQGVSDQTLRDEVAIVYFELGKVLESFGDRSKAQVSYKKVAEWGGRIQEPGRLILSKGLYKDPHSVKDTSSLSVSLPDTQSSSPPLLSQVSPVSNADIAPPQIFAEDMHLPVIACKLPKAGETLRDTAQLTYCLSLLQSPPLSEGGLGQAARDWLMVTKADSSEQERLDYLATGVIRALGQDELKNSDAVGEVVFLSLVLLKEDYRNLLGRLVDGFERSYLLDFSLLEGLAQLIQGASQNYLEADDLVKILGLISKRLQDTHGQSTEHIYRLTQAISNVLDAMADSHVTGIDRERLHEPLLSYLDGLQTSSDPYLVYQAAYAFQALQYVPDNETPWDTALRRGGKVLAGVFGMVSAVKGLDVNGFIDGLGKIQDGVAGVGAFFCTAKDACDGIVLLAENGQTLAESLKEVVRFNRKRQWYTALRGADTLLQCGQLVEFQSLVYEAPCRLDPAFQWGICERLGKLAANSIWNATIRQQAIVFLGEIYRNDAVWGEQSRVKQWIVDILVQLASLSQSDTQVADASEKLLKELERDGNAKKQVLFRSYREKGPSHHPLKVTSLLLAKSSSSSLLDRAQRKADFMSDVLRLRQRRLEEQGDSIYIPPQAKASLKALDEAGSLFPLMDKVKEFLESDQKVFLVLGDSGAGKSTFNKTLERDLWNNYKKDHSPIPLYIHLPAIDRPEHDLITKQLHREHFTDKQIKEMKECEFILICDGYDESQQTSNLYTCNQLNRPGQWRAQMIISCRSEYLEQDYLDSFQTEDRNQITPSKQFQEAVIAPFSERQIQEYIEQYVSMDQRPWKSTDYQRAFKSIPQLLGLVKNPFLLALSMEVLPSMVDLQQNLTNAKITRVSLYDQFVDLWLERGRKRLREKILSEQGKRTFKRLVNDGFKQHGVRFMKELSVSMYEKQSGNPVVEYVPLRDAGTWKENFFSDGEEAQILREVCPLTCSGNIYKFIHRSLLEYGVARAVFDSDESTVSMKQAPPPARRGSVSSVSSLESEVALEEPTVDLGQSLLDTPLWRNNLLGEPSILQFLEGRVHHEPLFKDQLLAVIERSKTDKAASKAAANAITILVRAGVRFNGTDLRGIQIPRADLTGGEFDSAQLQGADLRKVNLRNVWLSQANLSGARMAGVQFGELPYLKYDDRLFVCAYSRDGEIFAVGLAEGSIDIYLASTWEKTSTLTCSSEMVFSITFSLNGDRIASCCSDGTIQLWDVKTGTCLRVFGSRKGAAMSVAYSPKGDQIASGSRDGTVRLWDVETGECTQSFCGHSGGVPGLDYSPDGGRIVSGGEDKTVRLWEVKTGGCYHVFEGHSERVNSVAFISDGGRIVSGSNDQTVRLWDVETKACRHILQGHVDSVLCVVFSPKSNQIVSGSMDKTLRLWEIDTGACLQVFSGHTDWVMGVAYSRNSNHIASTGGDGMVRLWDTQAKIPNYSLNAIGAEVRAVFILSHSDYIASYCRDDSVHLWNFETGAYHKTFSGYSGDILSVHGSPNGEGVVFSCSFEEKSVQAWSIESGACINTFHCDSGCHSAFSPTRDKLAYVDNIDKGLVRLWDLGTDECCQAFKGHPRSVRSIAYSPNGSMIATGGGGGSGIGLGDNTVRVWDTKTGECRHILSGHSWPAESIAFSPEGRQVASGSKDRTMRLWDVETGECLHTLGGHDGKIRSVGYSPKGNLVASGSEDMTVRIWDVESGQCRAVVRDFHGGVESIAWNETRDGIYLVAGSWEDRSVRSWKVIEEGDGCILRLHWSTTHDQLTVVNTSLQGVEGLSPVNERLLKQRGAIISGQM
ncbi:hypothetical protein BGX26_007258 [Mortierella sp. AD094]|nr:hypothetical protein BGX26_007258 [Mortierella sp. AD094]